MEPLKELEHVLEEEVREHTHRAEEESEQLHEPASTISSLYPPYG